VILSTRFLLTRFSGFAPIAMSLGALGLVVVAIATGATDSATGDEGTFARLWQLLIVGQLPTIVWFTVQWVSVAPRSGSIVLGAQLLAGLTALAPVFLLRL
jgi:hypothetical protein